MRHVARAAALVVAAVAFSPQTRADATNTGELVDRSKLRVCADPAHLPFSNAAGEGFENKIAEMMAAELGRPVTYSFYPNTTGFVRNTLRAATCDLIMGVVTADELVQNTNPYYRSTYVLVHRRSDGDRFASLDAPAFSGARIGVVAGTPPASLISRRNLIAQVRPYQLYVDSRVDDPAKAMIADLEAGAIDVAMLWGPLAGWLAKNASVPLEVTPLPSDPRAGLRMDFRISMGIRYNEDIWKHEVNDLIRELQPRFTEVLLEFGVPLLDERGNLIGSEAAAAAATVPEPEGYRTTRYRAPVPATVEGGTVVDSRGLEELIGTLRPVLVDVMPRTRRPPGRDADQVWIEPKRMTLPGSSWLPNTGYGELTPEFRTFLAEGLERLTGGDKGKPVVFFCDANCWMSWNAAKRAVTELGYGRVYWYPQGTDGWKGAGGQLVEAQSPEMPGYAQN